jgi:hypothetical protein
MQRDGGPPGAVGALAAQVERVETTAHQPHRIEARRLMG